MLFLLYIKQYHNKHLQVHTFINTEVTKRLQSLLSLLLKYVAFFIKHINSFLLVCYCMASVCPQGPMALIPAPLPPSYSWLFSHHF